jgi:hypothetical protein
MTVAHVQQCLPAGCSCLGSGTAWCMCTLMQLICPWAPLLCSCLGHLMTSAAAWLCRWRTLYSASLQALPPPPPCRQRCHLLGAAAPQPRPQLRSLPGHRRLSAPCGQPLSQHHLPDGLRWAPVSGVHTSIVCCAALCCAQCRLLLDVLYIVCAS